MKWFSLSILVFFVFSCGNDPFEIDTSNTKYSLKSTDLPLAILRKSENQRSKELQRFSNEMPKVFAYHMGYCWQLGNEYSETMVNRYDSLLKIPYIVKLHQRVNEKFPNLKLHDTKIEKAFIRLKTYIPNAKLPEKLVYLNSNFATSVFCTESEVVVGLERYLGKETDVIQQLPPNQFYDWIKEAMDAQYLERDVVLAWIYSHLVEEKDGMKNIEAVVWWGKILYLTEACLNEVPKEQILRYSKKNYDWALANERAFWDYLVKQNLLFEVSENTQRSLLAEAPFTAGLPMKAPDRFGQFLGWRIVHSYMEQNEVSVQELLKIPYEEIIQDYEIAD